MLIESLPKEWKNKYILIYQNEKREDHEDNYHVFEDGHIEVYIRNNLSDYGHWVGINILLEKNIIPKDTWFLFIHDTCKFLNDNSSVLTYEIIKNHHETDIDILWLCSTGLCNICLIRRKGVTYGYDLYKDMEYMSKMDTIKYEWNHNEKLSPKSWNVIQKYIDIPGKYLELRYVYNNINHRNVLLYESINMEKYFFFTLKESDHPLCP
jgi:hypothetical protein